MYPQSAQPDGKYLDLRDLAVLVLDDNANTRTLISEVLRGLGVRRIYRTASCSDALSVMKSHAIDVLFVDIELEGDDGLGFIRKVRAAPEPKICNAAAIIVSSHATEARVMEAGVVGADGFLSKPFTVGGFAKRLTEGLAARRWVATTPPRSVAQAAANQIEL
jgi:CheY-like chemotaxis protein